MAQHGVTRRVFLFCLLAAPAAAQDFMRMPLAELEKDAENLPPAGLYTLAARRFREGPQQDAVRWLYVAQLRARFRLAATPDLPRSGEPALYAALNESVGRPINEWAFGDVDALAASLQDALDWDAAHANAATPKPGNEAVLNRIRAGLAEMRETVLASREKIRQQRSANGLENR
ncbi:hypothetical protein BKE38_14175 [Pseudoroseomonas deserti]|uniref:Uncharacterized protein n=1 Tax=Teichococcus deserti TaxID=1817963 RepID=A0A1V2H1P8_9PROT|nr:hypothetical protein [Pseudoroseomonas deserti]ONG52606.1 hypothetical protein BKE38_14175 [Pseudoroseomonas deserti]